MKRFTLGLFGIAAGAWAFAADSYFGIYLDGGKIGYSISREPSAPDAQGLRWSVSETVFRSTMLGADLDMKIVSRTQTTAQGAPVRMEYITESSGRTQTVLAFFEPKIIRIEVDNNGTKSTRKLDIPPGARVVDDATSALILEGPGAVKSFKVHVLDPTTLTLIVNDVSLNGPTKVDIKGRLTDATLVTVKDPRAISKIFYSSTGDVIKIEGALGMVMLPETEADALDISAPRTDLAESSAIRVNQPLNRALDTNEVTFSVIGSDLSRLPSDSYQTTQKRGDTWIVRVHPVNRQSLPDRQISVANRFAKQWLRPSLHIPADSPEFNTLAKKILGNETKVIAGSEKISRWIYATMKSNAGIGILRDATEVLATKEGVCRDYAILAATLMRSAGIPTRVASGLIYDNQQMYYHAWVEVWSGKEWFMLDPTRANLPTNATRIKLAHGHVETAFTFPVLSRTRIELTNVRYR